MSKPEQKQSQSDDLVTEVGDQDDFDQAVPMEDEESDEEDTANLKEEMDEMHDRIDKMEKHILKGQAQIMAKLDSLLLVNQALMPGSPVIPQPQSSPQKPKANKKKGGK
jgi:uncharacterized protein (UPF0305 family)